MRPDAHARLTGPLVLATVGLAVFCAGCDELLRTHRATDPFPKPTKAIRTVPPGIATAALGMNTGGDQFSPTPVDVGIAFDVSFGDQTFRQVIASCRSAGRGGEQIDTLGFSTPAYLDSIECDGRGIAIRADGARVEAFEVASGKVLGVVPVPPGAKVVHGYSFQYDAPPP